MKAVEDSPEGVRVRRAHWGEQRVVFQSIDAGFDIRSRLAGLEDDACQLPHWGYCLKGQFRVRYSDGSEETISAGDAYYMSPGHVPEYIEDCEIVDFTPAAQADAQRAKLQDLRDMA